MKKVTALILACAVCLVAYGLTGCQHTHEWTSATCSSPMICSKCGESEGSPIDHIWNAATCEQAKHCTMCGTTEGNALGHDWIDPTCTDAEICRICGKTGRAALGHTLDVVNEAQNLTCGQDGILESCCSVCGKVVTEITPATGEHVINNWVTLTPATCTSKGIEEGLCSICQQVSTRELDILEHADNEVWTVITAPTLLSSGERATHCKDCGVVLQKEEFNLSLEEKNALKSAENYLSFMAFSRSGLIKQLEFEGYSREAATTAVDSLVVDWKEQAAKSAENYMSLMSFSRSRLIQQLKFEGFSEEEAEYGATFVGY